MENSDKHELKELFEKIDGTGGGLILLGDLVSFLRMVYEAEIERKYQVKILLDRYEVNGNMRLNFNKFCEMLDEISSAGWGRDTGQEKEAIEYMDMTSTGTHNF